MSRIKIKTGEKSTININVDRLKKEKGVFDAGIIILKNHNAFNSIIKRIKNFFLMANLLSLPNFISWWLKKEMNLPPATTNPI